MTLAHDTPATPAPTLEAALELVRGQGLRVTTTRRLLLAELYTVEGPLSAEELCGRVLGADLASVYRNLETLESIGVVRHVHLGHGPGLYTLVAASGDVEYVTCERCGAYEAVDPARLDRARTQIEREVGYRARFTHFPIVGLCPACSTVTTSKEGRTHAHP
jgi:Fur family transcriptional regulator, ferric uptake regulator